MLWYILGGVGALGVLILLGGYVAFHIALVRRKTKDFTEIPRFKETYADYLPWMTKATADWRTEPFEAVSITSFDGLKLAARLYDIENPRGTAILCHGYRANCQRDFGCGYAMYRRMGYRVLAVDNRAAGQSEGMIIGMGVLERHDCAAWAWYVHDRFGEASPIFLCGLSMGAATVMMAPSLPLPANVRAISADCGFTSGQEIVAKVIREDFHLPAGLILPLINAYCRLLKGFTLHDCTATETLRHCTIPVIFLHGVQDGFVPAYMSERNFEACASKKQLILVEKADHGMSYLMEPERCEAALRAFFDAACEEDAP